MEFPLSLTDSTRAEDARPVEFPTRALWSSPLASRIRHGRRTRALWSSPLA